jgi:hypothetical protein
MYQVSELTGQVYDDDDMVHFRNYVQSAYYVAWGAKLVDLYVSSDMKFVYIFSKEDHNRYKMRWGQKNNNYRTQMENK